MQPNYLAVIVATVIEFIIGAVWYTAFGKVWGEINGYNKLPKAVQEKLMKQMGPLYGIQFFVTLVTTFVMALFISNLPDWNAYAMGAFFWIGFVVPTQVSAALFGNTDQKWIVKKILIQGGASFLCLEAAAIVLHMMH